FAMLPPGCVCGLKRGRGRATDGSPGIAQSTYYGLASTLNINGDRMEISNRSMRGAMLGGALAVLTSVGAIAGTAPSLAAQTDSSAAVQVGQSAPDFE